MKFLRVGSVVFLSGALLTAGSGLRLIEAAKSGDAQAVRAFLSGWYETVVFMRADKAATIPVAARQMDVSAILAGKVHDELIDNYSRDGRFDPEGLRVLVDSLVEMGALKSADVKAFYTEEYLPPR